MSNKPKHGHSQSKSILFFIDSLSPAGGQERVVAKHIEYASTIYQTSLLTKDDGSSYYELPQNIAKYSLNSTHVLCMTSRLSRISHIVKSLVSNRAKLKRTIEMIGAEYIYVSSPRNFFEVALATGALSKIIVSEHSAHDAHNFVYKTIILLLYRFSRRFFVPTKVDSYHYGRFRIPNTYLPNPLPFEHEHRSNLEEKTILSIGRFTKDKRHLMLLEVWARCECKNMGWKLKLIGNGELLEEITKRSKEPDVQGSVEITGPTKDVMRAYENASIFALTSSREGFGLVLAEAMSFGIPCIAFSVPSGPLDIVKNGVNGFLIEDGNIREFSRQIDALATQDGFRKQFSQPCIDSVKPFANDKIKKQFIHALML